MRIRDDCLYSKAQWRNLLGHSCGKLMSFELVLKEERFAKGVVVSLLFYFCALFKSFIFPGDQELSKPHFPMLTLLPDSCFCSFCSIHRLTVCTFCGLTEIRKPGELMFLFFWWHFLRFQADLSSGSHSHGGAQTRPAWVQCWVRQWKWAGSDVRFPTVFPFPHLLLFFFYFVWSWTQDLGTVSLDYASETDLKFVLWSHFLGCNR